MSNFISRLSDRIDDSLGGAFNRLTGHMSAAERREQGNMVNEQINAYKEQTRLAKEETDRKRGETAAAKRKVEEKQIRSLRRNYRPAGFLNNAKPAGEAEPGVQENLGG